MANKVEDYWLFGVQAAQALAMSFMIGLVFFQMTKDQSSVSDRFGLLYFMAALYPYMVTLDVTSYCKRVFCLSLISLVGFL